jgi:spermidine synthase
VPLALAAAAETDTGRVASRVYAANTLGAIVGALATELVLIVWLGSERTQQLLVVACALAGACALLRSGVRLRALTRAAVAIVALIVLALAVPALPREVIAYGRFTPTRGVGANVIYAREGITGAVAVSEEGEGLRTYHSAGKAQASSHPQDMRLQRMLGHLTTLVHPAAKRVVVIGCGAGVTAGAVSIDPYLDQETIAEIEPLVPKVVSTYFADHNFSVVTNPKVHVQLDDARHYLLTTKEKFDAITSDPLDPWVKGAAMLYTREFFEIVKQHLNPGGVVTLFVQLYESNLEAVKSEIATFMEAFPNGVVWGNTQDGRGYDLVVMGTLEPLQINVDEIEAKLNLPEYARVKKSLSEIGMYSAVDLFSTYAGRGPDLTGWTRDAMINRDRNLRLQYLAGMWLNAQMGAEILASILAHYRFPEETFTGSPGRLQSLKRALEETGRRSRDGLTRDDLGR